MPIPVFPIRHVCLCPSIIHFIPREEGDFVRSLSVCLWEEVFNTRLQLISWHVACILTVIHCGDKICDPVWLMMADGVVLSEIVCQIMFSRHPIYQKLSLADSISDPVKLHAGFSWTLSVDVVVDKSVSFGAVHHFWCGWLVVAHIY